MYKIALIDDKDYGIKQILNAIPEEIDYKFEFFDSYKKALNKHFDVILLDYFLDIDRVVGEDIIDKLDAKIIVGFSSVESCNKKLLGKNAKYGVNKLRKTDKNPELENVFGLIFYNDLK